MKSPAKNVNRPNCAGQQTTLSRFNGWGQRFLRDTPNAQTVFSYGTDGHNQLSETTRNLSTSALSITEHIWLPTASGPMPVAAVINGVHHAVHADHLNTPRKLIDSAGQTRWQWPYSGFGEINPQSTPAAGQAAVSYSLRYPGQIDDGNGLFFNWHRFYDPRVGRYTSSDPIGLEGGWNRFGYVEGNPLGFVDPEDLKGGGAGASNFRLPSNAWRQPQLPYMPTPLPGPQPIAVPVRPTPPTGNPNRQTYWELAKESFGNLDKNTPSNLNWGGPMPRLPYHGGQCRYICLSSSGDACLAKPKCEIVCGPTFGVSP